MEINKKTLKQFRASFALAVRELEDEYKVSVKLGNISYGDISFTGKIEVIAGSNASRGNFGSRFFQELKKFGNLNEL